jgi:hypothetical protein
MMPVLSAVLSSCCLGNYKCNAENFNESYRLLSFNGNDLLFGAGRVYDVAAIRLFSLNGTDTVFHHTGAGPNPQPGRDSLLYVNYDYRKFQTVYVRLTSTDTDTIQLLYETVDASPCCPDYFSVSTATYNNAPPEKGSFGELYLRK